MANWKLIEALPGKDDEYIIAARKANYTEWGSPQLSVEQYLERESLLGSTKFALNSQHTWILQDSDGRIAAHCETFHRPCWVYTGDNRQELQCAGVASVFVRPEYRGQGLGTLMMIQLRSQLADKMGVAASILYSDVGRRYYSRPSLEWLPFSTRQLVIDVALFQSESVAGARTIDSEQIVRKLVEDDLSKLEDELKQAASQSGSGTVGFVILPNLDNYKWFRTRSQVYQQIIGEESQRGINLPWGCYVDEDNWMIYFYDYKEWNLYILRHRCIDDPIAVGQLLNQAVLHARIFGTHFHLLFPRSIERQLGFKTVTVWQPHYSMMNSIITSDLSFSAGSSMLFSTNESPLPDPIQISPSCKLCWRSDEEGSIPSLTLLKIPSLNSSNVNIAWIGCEKFAWI